MGQLDFSNIEAMSEAEERRFMTAFTNALASDKGEAAKEHLAAGFPIYYGDDRYPDAVIKEYPDGRKQLVRVEKGAEIVLKQL